MPLIFVAKSLRLKVISFQGWGIKANAQLSKSVWLKVWDTCLLVLCVIPFWEYYSTFPITARTWHIWRISNLLIYLHIFQLHHLSRLLFLNICHIILFLHFELQVEINSTKLFLSHSNPRATQQKHSICKEVRCLQKCVPATHQRQ